MLKVENLCSGYGTIMILRDVSFELNQGEIVAIIGRNGVGKSTLIKSLIGLIRPKSGRVIYGDHEITRMKPYERARLGIGYVPQGHGVFPLLTVRENLKMGETINGTGTDKSLEIAYEYFPRLFERREQKAGTLSGGEQAMLSIARTLIGRPKLMMLDEPSEGIQPNLAFQIGEIVKKSSQDMGLSVIISEQHIGLIQTCAQKCYALDKGIVIGELNGDEIQDYNCIKRYLTV